MLHDTPLLDDPRRVRVVSAFGAEKTPFRKAAKEHPTLYSTELVDIYRPVIIDMVEGNSAFSLRSLCGGADPEWSGEITILAH